MIKLYTWALLLLLAAPPSLWGQAELVRDILPGPASSRPKSVYRYDERLLFSANAPAGERCFSLDTSLVATQLWANQSDPVVNMPFLYRRTGADLFVHLMRRTAVGSSAYGQFARVNPITNQLTPILIDTITNYNAVAMLSSEVSADMVAIHRNIDGWVVLVPSKHFLYNPSTAQQRFLFGLDGPLDNGVTTYDYNFLENGFFYGVGIQNWNTTHLCRHDLATNSVDTVFQRTDSTELVSPFGLPTYFQQRLHGRLFMVGRFGDLVNDTSSQEVFVYSDLEGVRRYRRFTRFYQKGVKSLRAITHLMAYKNYLLVASKRANAADRTHIMAYDPATGVGRRVAEVPSGLSDVTLRSGRVHGDTLYFFDNDTTIEGVSSRIFRVVLSGPNLLAGTSVQPIEPYTIPNLPWRPGYMPYLSSSESMGFTDSWFHITYLFQRSFGDFYNEVIARHLPSGRWYSTAGMSTDPRGSAGSVVIPTQLGQDLYISATTDAVGAELFRFRPPVSQPPVVETCPPTTGSRFSILPNPTTGAVSLTTTGDVELIRYRVVTVLGQSLGAGEGTRAEVELALSRTFRGAAEGLYLVSLEACGSSEVHRVLRTSN